MTNKEIKNNKCIKVCAYLHFKGKHKLTYIGLLTKNGTFKFRKKILRKVALNNLKTTFLYECPGGSLTIPNIDGHSALLSLNLDKFIICYTSFIPKKENSKYIATYWKKNNL